MVTTVGEVDMARALVDRELKLMRRRGAPDPTRVLLGAMIEVPSLLFELDALLPRVDFVSVGSNDLLQYLFAADRNNARVSTRYDALSAAPLRALAAIVDAAKRHNRPLSLCGEMAGRPLEAMALIGSGLPFHFHGAGLRRPRQIDDPQPRRRRHRALDGGPISTAARAACAPASSGSPRNRAWKSRDLPR